MDYSKYGISQKKHDLKAGGKKARKKAGFTVFRVFIICIILFAVIGVSAAVGGVKGIIDSAPEINISDIAPKDFKSYIYNADGSLSHEIVGEASNRIYVPIDQISKSIQDAFIALEDARFRTHNGIDPRGIVRAFFVGVKNGGFTEGASTITQQLLKLSVFSGGEEPSLLLKFRRKFQEQYLAMELEKQLSKDEILEAYLNTINLGRGCYGVEAASNYYFDKHASELTISEAAALASIAQSPTRNNPIDNPDINESRRKKTINDMFSQGLITEDEKDQAFADHTLYSRIESNAEKYSAEATELYTFYEEAAIKQVIADLQTEYGMTESEANDKVYSGAIKIYLAQDPEIQQVCDEFYANDANFPMTEYLMQYTLSVYPDPDDDFTQNYNEYDVAKYMGKEYPLYSSVEAGETDLAAFREHLGLNEDMKYVEIINFVPQIQSSFVVMDQHTGYVSAVIAGRGEKTGNMVLNRATSSPRQPGSVFKIVSTYAPALDYVGKSLASSNIDKNIVYPPPSNHVIRNVDGDGKNTYYTFRQAIALSKNTIAVRTLQEDVGHELALTYLTENFHFTTMDMVNDAVDVLAIGGITNGVTNLELTAAFASIANSGMYNRPVFYTKVLDSNDKVLLDNTTPEPTRSLKETTAWLLTDAMKDVVYSSIGSAYGLVYVPNMTVAGKTGTTDDYRDTWFVGYSPYYTAGIWYGYDNNISPERRYGWRTGTHEVLWGKIMTRINEVKGLEQKDFTMPEGIVQKSVCRFTGLLPGSQCSTTYEYVDANTTGTQVCTECRWMTICSVCGGIANGNTTSPTTIRYSESNKSNVPSYYCTCVYIPPVVDTPPEEGGETPPPEGGGETPPPEGGGETPPVEPAA